MSIHKPIIVTLILLPFLICFSFVGCQSPQSQLIGTWTVDIEELNRNPEALKIAPPAGELARTWKMNMVKDWVFRFNADRSLEMNFQGMHYQGRYKVTSQVGNTLFIKTEMRPLPANGIDALLDVNVDAQKSVTERFSIKFAGKNTTLKLDSFTPIMLIKSPTIF